MSKKQNALFACGEILNVTGDCGGYNLHFAFTSGRLAGASAVKFLNK
jgi:predicted flavoprotein YhiN